MYCSQVYGNICGTLNFHIHTRIVIQVLQSLAVCHQFSCKRNPEEHFLMQHSHVPLASATGPLAINFVRQFHIVSQGSATS